MLFIASFSAIPSYADDIDEPSHDLIQSRSYVGVFLSYMGINKDKEFDGNWAGASSSPPEFDIVSGINSNIGFGFLVGHREGDVALEVSYWRSDHSTYWAPGTPSSVTGTATYQSVEVNLKRYLFTEQRVQPFLQIGLGNPWLNYPDGSTDGTNVSAFSLSGLGFDVGGGVEIYIDNVFSIVGGLFYRWGTFDHAYGIQKIEWTALGNFEGDGFDLYSGMTMKVW
jgi:opacity protein-like surface antigen